MRKKLMAMLLCVAMLLTLLPTYAFAAYQGSEEVAVGATIELDDSNRLVAGRNDRTWTTTDPTVATVSGHGDRLNQGTVRGLKPGTVTIDSGVSTWTVTVTLAERDLKATYYEEFTGSSLTSGKNYIITSSDSKAIPNDGEQGVTVTFGELDTGKYLLTSNNADDVVKTAKSGGKVSFDDQSWEKSGNGLTRTESSCGGTDTYNVTYSSGNFGNQKNGAAASLNFYQAATETWTVKDAYFTYADGENHMPTVTPPASQLFLVKYYVGATNPDTGAGYSDTPEWPTAVGTHTVWVGLFNGTSRVASVSAKVFIGKADIPSTAITAPVDAAKAYSGEDQALVTAGSTTAVGATMVYAVVDDGEDAPAADAYSMDVPEETAVGNYDVYYKVLGGTNYNDTEPVKVDASIVKAAVTLTAPNATVPYRGTNEEVKFAEDAAVTVGGAGATAFNSEVEAEELTFALKDSVVVTTLAPNEVVASAIEVTYEAEGDIADNFNITSVDGELKVEAVEHNFNGTDKKIPDDLYLTGGTPDGDSYNDYVGESTKTLDGNGTTGNPAIELVYVDEVKTANVLEETEIEEIMENAPVSAGERAYDVLEVELYIVEDGAYTKVEGAVLSAGVEVLLPYDKAVMGGEYKVLHYDGSSYEDVGTVEVVENGGQRYLKFTYNKFSPFIVIGSVDYNSVNATVGEGYEITYTGLAESDVVYTFTFTVKEGYSFVKATANGNELVEGVTGQYRYTYDEATKVYTGKIDPLNDNYTLHVYVTKDPIVSKVTYVNGADTLVVAPYVADATTDPVTYLTAAEGTTITVLGALDDTDEKEFVGWKFNGTVYDAGDILMMPAYDVTFKAVWEDIPTMYTLTYDADGAAEAAPAAQQYVENSVAVVSGVALTKADYVFKGWLDESTDPDTLYAANDSLVMNADKTLKAIWAPVYGVTYDNGGATGTTPVDSNKYEAGQSFTTLPDAGLSMTNYSFAGWLSNNGTPANPDDDVLYAAGSTYAMPAANITLTAKWVENTTYTVTYAANGATEGTAVTDSTAYYAGEQATVKANTFVKTGETFLNWNTEPTGTGTTYKPTDKITMTENVTLYAQWTSDYVITFDDNLGSWEQEYVTFDNATYNSTSGYVTIGAPKNTGNYVNAPVMARVGYVFAGWYTTPACDGVNYYDGTGFKLTDANVEALDPDNNKQITLYANWTPEFNTATSVRVKAETLAPATYGLYYSDFATAAAYDEGLVDPWGNRVYRNFIETTSTGEKITTSVLPAGLHLNQRTGEIYGVPTCAAGTYDFYVRIANDKFEENTKQNYNWISAPQKLSIVVSEITLSVDRSAVAVTDKTYGDDDPAVNYTSSMVKFTLDGDDLTDTLATISTGTQAKVTTNGTDATAVITYDYTVANTANTNKWTDFEGYATKTDLLANLSDARDPAAATFAANDDTVTAALERNTKYEDVGTYKMYLDKADTKYFVALDGTTKDQVNDQTPAYYALTIAPAFADKNLTHDDPAVDYAAPYIFKITQHAAPAYSVTKTYGEVKAETVLTGGTWINLVGKDSILVVDDENTVKAVAGLTPLSGAGFLRAGTYNTGVLEYTLKNTKFDSTMDGSAAPAGTKSEATTDYYAAATLSLKIDPLELTVAGQNINVTKGTIPTEANITALATLTGVLSGDTVNLTGISYEYNSVPYDAAGLITALGTIDADKTVTVHYTAVDNMDYTVTAGSVTGTLHAYTPSTGSYVAPATYTVTCGKGVTADKATASSGATVTLTVAEGYDAPVVKDADGNTVTVKASGSKYTFKMPASDVTVSVTGDYSTCLKDEDCVLEQFTDLTNDYWYHDGIHYCLDNGIMNGMSATTFGPSLATTRGMIVTMLARLSGYKVNGAGNEWYIPSMEWAVANGISDGTNMTGNITREQLATMLYRYAVEIAKVDTSKFTADTNTLSYDDVFTVSEWANEGVHFCLAAGVIGGYEDGTIRPQANATRAEVAAMFQRFCVIVLGK